MFDPVQRSSLSDQVFAQLRDQIVTGAREPGDPLPSERVLAETLGINRGAVREALKRLAQARLVAVRQGGATRVLDYRKTAGIDLLGAMVVRANGQLDPDVVRSIMEMRSALAPAIARAAAERAGAELGDALDGALEALEAAPDSAARAERSRAYWSLLIDGADNIAYRLAYNSLNDTTARLDGVLGDVMADEFTATDLYGALSAAVVAGDGVAAADAASALVSLGQSAIDRLMAVLSSNFDLPNPQRT